MLQQDKQSRNRKIAKQKPERSAAMCVKHGISNIFFDFPCHTPCNIANLRKMLPSPFTNAKPIDLLHNLETYRQTQPKNSRFSEKKWHLTAVFGWFFGGHWGYATGLIQSREKYSFCHTKLRKWLFHIRLRHGSCFLPFRWLPVFW